MLLSSVAEPHHFSGAGAVTLCSGALANIQHSVDRFSKMSQTATLVEEYVQTMEANILISLVSVFLSTFKKP
jgi:hypothetical protein